MLPGCDVIRGRSFFIRRDCGPSVYGSSLDFLDHDFRQRFGRHPCLRRAYCLFLAGAAGRHDHAADDFGTLAHKFVVPGRVRSGRAIGHFLRDYKRFRHVIGSDDLLHLIHLSSSRVAKASASTNVVRGCFSLSRRSATYLRSLSLKTNRVGINSGCLYLRALSSPRSLPSNITASAHCRHLSASHDSYHLSFTTPVKVLLAYGRIIGRCLFVSSSTRGLQGFRRATEGVRSLSHCDHSGRVGHR